MSHVAVIGGGAFGTAMAISLARDRRAVTLWARDPGEMQAARENTRRLPGFRLPDTITVTGDIAEAAAAPIVLLAIPLQTLARVGRDEARVGLHEVATAPLQAARIRGERRAQLVEELLRVVDRDAWIPELAREPVRSGPAPREHELHRAAHRARALVEHAATPGAIGDHELRRLRRRGGATVGRWQTSRRISAASMSGCGAGRSASSRLRSSSSCGRRRPRDRWRSSSARSPSACRPASTRPRCGNC